MLAPRAPASRRSRRKLAHLFRSAAVRRLRRPVEMSGASTTDSFAATRGLLAPFLSPSRLLKNGFEPPKRHGRQEERGETGLSLLALLAPWRFLLCARGKINGLLAHRAARGGRSQTGDPRTDKDDLGVRYSRSVKTAQHGVLEVLPRLSGKSLAPVFEHEIGGNLCCGSEANAPSHVTDRVTISPGEISQRGLVGRGRRRIRVVQSIRPASLLPLRRRRVGSQAGAAQQGRRRRLRKSGVGRIPPP